MKKKPAKKTAPKVKKVHILDKKHRPVHGMVAGAALTLLHSVSVVVSVIGVLLVLVSVIVYLLRLKKSSR